MESESWARPGMTRKESPRRELCRVTRMMSDIQRIVLGIPLGLEHSLSLHETEEIL